MNVYTDNDTVKTERNLDNVVLSLRLRGAEAVRFWKIMDSAKHRNPYIDKTDVIRELIRIDPPHLLTEAELNFFTTGKKDGTSRGIPTIDLHLSSKKDGGTKRKTG